jgi:hypothetical protein
LSAGDSSGGRYIVQTVVREDITLAHVGAGPGTAPLVFVHGWSGDHTVMIERFLAVAVPGLSHVPSEQDNRESVVAAARAIELI